MLDVCSGLSHECASSVCAVFLKRQAVTLCFQKLLIEGTRDRNYRAGVQVVPRRLRAKASAVKLLVERL